MSADNEFLTNNTRINYPFREDVNVGLADYISHTPPLITRDCIVDALVCPPANNLTVYPSTETRVETEYVLRTGSTTYAIMIAVMNLEATSTGWRTHIGHEDPLAYAFVLDTSLLRVNGDFSYYAAESSEVARQLFTGLVPAVYLVPTAGQTGLKLTFGHTAWLGYLSGIGIGQMDALNLIFSSCTVVGDSRRPLSITLDNLGVLSDKIDGDVKLRMGYNLSQSRTGDPLTTNYLTLGAVPGAGEGVAPNDCLPLGGETKWNMAVIPDSAGNIQIETDDCTQIYPVSRTGDLMLYSRCAPCCTCDDYKNVLEAMRKFNDRSKAIHCKLSRTHKGADADVEAPCVLDTIRPDCGETMVGVTGIDRSYDFGVQLFNKCIAPRYIRPTLTITGTHGAEYANARGAPNVATFMVRLSNTSSARFITVMEYEVQLTTVPMVSGIPWVDTYLEGRTLSSWGLGDETARESGEYRPAAVGGQAYVHPTLDEQVPLTLNVGRGQCLGMVHTVLAPYIATTPPAHMYTEWKAEAIVKVLGQTPEGTWIAWDLKAKVTLT